jgi:hypothetical protein
MSIWPLARANPVVGYLALSEVVPGLSDIRFRPEVVHLVMPSDTDVNAYFAFV